MEEEERLKRALLPHVYQRLDLIKDNPDARFVHYTTAESAIKIFDSQTIWLRNARVMNDFSEVAYGGFCVNYAITKSEFADRFRSFLSGLDKDLADNVLERHAGLDQQRRDGTFIFSVGEHDCVKEGTSGKLSMWRAYAPNNGVALVFHKKPFIEEADIPAYSSPVVYPTPEGFAADYFGQLIESLERERDLLASYSTDVIADALMRVLHFATLSTKHPSFSEEREWRVLYSPAMNDIFTAGGDPVLEPDIAVIGGVPQEIQALPLKRFQLTDYSTALCDILETVIVGPTDYPEIIAGAFETKLRSAGFKHPNQHIQISRVPLRRN